MIIKEKKIEENNSSPFKKTYRIESLSTILSVVLHFLVFASFVILYNIGDMIINGGGGPLGTGGGKGGGSRSAYGSFRSRELTEITPEGKPRTEKDNKINKDVPVKNKSQSSEDKIFSKETGEIAHNNGTASEGYSGILNPGRQGSGGYSTVEGSGFDTTGLGGYYSEKTFNIRIQYPTGWQYVDQQSKSKLDGVTFWSLDNAYNPPPYIHLDVVEKYMFNSNKYVHKFDFSGFTGYYNDPEEMEGQVSQSIYIKTDGEKDYIIKLIMQGRDQFISFQPRFFAIVRSFKFGFSWF